MSDSGTRGQNASCKSAKEHLVQIQPQEPPMYWKSVAELHGGQRGAGEFPGGLPPASQHGTTRRDFLSLMGFTLAAAGLSGCRAPVQNAIPLLVGSDQLVPGVANWYATTCRGCAASCSLLAKQRDGRPIKIEGNAESQLFGGGTCATGQATVLSLYDDERLRGPLWQGQPTSWDEVDRRVVESVRVAQAAKHSIALLSGTINSPSTRAIISEWRGRYPNFVHVEYDPTSLSAMRAANKESFGLAVVPHYAFDRARVIVALDADFLGTWLSPVEFARQYAAGRKPEGAPSLHIQFESGMSVTGSNADLRIAVAPSELGPVAVALLARTARRAGHSGISHAQDPIDSRKLDAVADELWKHRGESLVISGCNDLAVQRAVNALNVMLGNVGKTIDLTRPSLQRNGDDQAMSDLVEKMNRGEVHSLFMLDVNPAYDYHDPARFLSGLEKVSLSVSFSDRRDETSSHVHALCPDHHFLEAWGDAEPVETHFSLAQPLIAPLFGTRSAQESLLKWLGREPADYYTYLRDYWQKNIFPRQRELHDFQSFWDRSLQDGVVTLPPLHAGVEPKFHDNWIAAVTSIRDEQTKRQAASSADQYEVQLYESVALRDGRQANNPWLQELPDPISKVTWGNYAAMASATAAKLKVMDGDVLQLKTETGQIEVPVFIQPGQHSQTISIALGYGRSKVGRAGQNIGSNAYPLVRFKDGHQQLGVQGVTLEKTERSEKLATTQAHFSMEGRPIVLETSLEELHKDAEPSGETALPTLWAARPEGEHAWGMAIDMNACTGCSACVVACQAENNVPVVGKDQIERIRVMHWIRLDRYYSGPEEDPVAVHQPMMCQHCQNAPCETVCPVLATTTSSEGLNQQVYNRCIGTRYCANNCPYKVRRFNWYNYTDNPQFDFNMENPLGRMVLNPDVAVRSRGVMEKCSMCVQRIQLAKNAALQGKRELVDGDIQTACQQACPTQAIVFGDLKDPNSRVSQLQHNRRRYQVLDELGTRPNVSYLKKVRNPVKTT